MFGAPVSLRQQLLRAMQIISNVVIVGAMLVALIATIAAAFNALPWPELSLRWGGQYFPEAGMYLQIGLTAMLVMLCFFLPANSRMSRLERSHRSFQI
jgi:ABC-type transport system involved in cytochrome c biogenesis permease subunit